MKPKIIYVTGAPATGKSTLTFSASKIVSNTLLFTYSKELLAHVGERTGATDQDALRAQSSKLISKEDVQAVDEKLIALANETRGRRSLIVDSHPVTIEDYGFRITAFSKLLLDKLRPDIVICLYADEEVIKQRIQSRPEGRPLPSDSNLKRHSDLQSTIAAMYGFEMASALYYLDSNRTPEELLANFMRVTRLNETE